MSNDIKRRLARLESRQSSDADTTTESILWDLARGCESPTTRVSAIKELRRGQATEPDKVADNRSWDQVKTDTEQLISEVLDLLETD